MRWSSSRRAAKVISSPLLSPAPPHHRHPRSAPAATQPTPHPAPTTHAQQPAATNPAATTQPPPPAHQPPPTPTHPTATSPEPVHHPQQTQYHHRYQTPRRITSNTTNPPPSSHPPHIPSITSGGPGWPGTPPVTPPLTCGNTTRTVPCRRACRGLGRATRDRVGGGLGGWGCFCAGGGVVALRRGRPGEGWPGGGACRGCELGA